MRRTPAGEPEPGLFLFGLCFGSLITVGTLVMAVCIQALAR